MGEPVMGMLNGHAKGVARFNHNARMVHECSMKLQHDEVLALAGWSSHELYMCLGKVKLRQATSDICDRRFRQRFDI